MRILFCFWVSFVMIAMVNPIKAEAQPFPEGYYDHLIPDGEHKLNETFNTVTTVTKEGEYISRMYYPDTKQLIGIVRASSSRFGSTMQGPYKTWWDDGDLDEEGFYKDGEKDSIWIKYDNNKIWREGSYSNGLKQGEWLDYFENGEINRLWNYVNDTLQGECMEYDSLGQEVQRWVYEKGELIEGEAEVQDELLPQFGSCYRAIDKEAMQKCTNNALGTFLSQHVKYPGKARRGGIEGTVYVKFMIDEMGKVTDVRSDRGVCDLLKIPSVNLVKKMPNWHPGHQDGKPVKVAYTLPIRYKLE